jgi:hypothetical protein
MDRAQALASRTGPGVESRRSEYRRSAIRLHSCRRASCDCRSGLGEYVIFSELNAFAFDDNIDLGSTANQIQPVKDTLQEPRARPLARLTESASRITTKNSEVGLTES